MSRRTYKPSQQTKSNILHHAIELFNEAGTTAVSMNALAGASGMSAGNLQYHYRSKQEIIRAILKDMFGEFDAAYAVHAELSPFEALRDRMRLSLDVIWRYRFFFREITVLLRQDKILARRFREMQTQRLQDQKQVLQQLMALGYVRPDLSPQELHNVVLIGWVLGNTWLSYVESTGQKITKATLDEAVEILVQHYKPYLKVKG